MEICDLSNYRQCYVPLAKHSPSELPPSPPESPKSSKPGSSTKAAASKKKKGTKSSKAASSTTESTITAPSTLDDMNEAILALVEQSIEQQMKKQMAKTTANLDCFGTQNHTLNEQIHLHYMSLQRQNEVFDSQIKALSSLTAMQADTIQSLQLHAADLYRAILSVPQQQANSPNNSPLETQQTHNTDMGHGCLDSHPSHSPTRTPTSQSRFGASPPRFQSTSRDQSWTNSTPLTRIPLERVRGAAGRPDRKSVVRKFLEKVWAVGR